jgi:ribosomal protein S18 acetylase RimI-like enzyme
MKKVQWQRCLFSTFQNYWITLSCFYSFFGRGSSFTIQYDSCQLLYKVTDRFLRSNICNCATIRPSDILKCYLVPLRTYDDKFEFIKQKSDTDVELCIIEENDIYDVSKFVVQTFGADAISLNQDMNRIEKLLVKPAVDLLNGYSGLVALAEVLAGIRSRVRLRTIATINPPNLDGLSRKEQIQIAEGTSIILVAATRPSDDEKNGKIIASVELRLQPCDAKIPFTLPLLDKIERFLAKTIRNEDKQEERDLQPYLSNLCVDENYRSKGLGRALVQCVEDIASTMWGYSFIYLHVDVENKPALELYKSEGYVDAGQRWNTFWVGSAAEIGYFAKKIV